MKANKIKRRRQRKLRRKYAKLFIMNMITVFVIMLITIAVGISQNNENEDEDISVVYESEKVNDHNAIASSANVSSEMYIAQNDKALNFSRNLTEEDKYLLAKIAMAEAEGESFETKVFIIFTILNRVESDEFPNTIREVIFQKNKNVYQFTPVMPNGRWWHVEPNEECWKAVEFVNTSELDVSNGALYFEACSGESWHSRNLDFICKSDNTRFYK